MKGFLIAALVINIGCFGQSKPTIQLPTVQPSPREQPTVRQPEIRPATPPQISSVQAILGADKVDSIVKRVIANATESLSSSFILTDESLMQLRKSGTSKSTLRKLQELKDQRVEGDDAFKATIRAKIGSEMWTPQFENDVLAHSRTTLVVNDEFVKQVESLILTSRAPSRVDPKEWLEKNFRRFLVGYVRYTEANSNHKNEITLQTSGLDKYLDGLKAKCGELSCPGTPPCCGDECDPCKP